MIFFMNVYLQESQHLSCVVWNKTAKGIIISIYVYHKMQLQKSLYNTHCSKIMQTHIRESVDSLSRDGVDARKKDVAREGYI